MGISHLTPILYPILKSTFPGCLWAGKTGSKAIALTFDDGPHPEHTPQLLDVLDRYQVPASFFWLGVCVEKYPDIARAICERGHWIGLHGYEHRAFTRLSKAALKQSLEKNQEAIADACGVEPTTLRDVRPPNGIFTPRILSYLQEWNYRSVMWSVVPEDWVRPGVSVVAQRVLRQVVDGSVIVLHDGYYGGQDVAETTALLVPQLRDRGFEFVTIDQLWQQCLGSIS